jgi:hypothetical protein
MAGYTPVFDSVFQGTLCGRWPDTGVWLCLLALADREGRIDSTIPYIAAVTGIPEETLTECIQRFMSPDPASRTKTDDGRRLAFIDPDRSWGWRVINHAKYREKARLLAKSQKEVESGKNKGRMQDRRGPPETAADRPSYSDINLNKDSEKNPSASATPMQDPEWWGEFKLTYPNRAGDQGWRKAQRAAHARTSEGHTAAEMIDGAKRYAAYCEATQKTGTEFVKQACSFLGPDKPFLLPWTPPPSKAQVRQDKNISASLQWLAEEEAKDAARRSS